MGLVHGGDVSDEQFRLRRERAEERGDVVVIREGAGASSAERRRGGHRFMSVIVNWKRYHKLSKMERAALAVRLAADALLAAEALDKFIAATPGSTENWGVLIEAFKLFSVDQQRRLLAIANTESL